MLIACLPTNHTLAMKKKTFLIVFTLCDLRECAHQLQRYRSLLPKILSFGICRVAALTPVSIMHPILIQPSCCLCRRFCVLSPARCHTDCLSSFALTTSPSQKGARPVPRRELSITNNLGVYRHSVLFGWARTASGVGYRPLYGGDIPLYTLHAHTYSCELVCQT